MVKIPSVSDLVKLGVEEVEALMALPSSIVLLNRSLANLAETVARMDGLVRRLDRMSEPLEEPLGDLLTALPPLMDSMQRNAVPALEMFGQTQAQVAVIASSVERLVGLFDEVFSRLVPDIPGVNLLNWFRSAAAPPAPLKRPDEGGLG